MTFTSTPGFQTLRSHITSSVALLALVATTSTAQSVRDTAALPALLAAEVVTATRVPGILRGSTSTVTVLDGEALRAEGVTHLADALRRVPGLALARSSSFGSQTALFVRGGQSNYVRVLVDGIPLNEPGGVLDLGRITLDDIERIEIVRGPASVLYGSEAVTGVIQLFTRRGGDRNLPHGAAPRSTLPSMHGASRSSTRAELGAGSFGGRRASLGTDGARGPLSWSLQGDDHASEGTLPFNNAYRNDALSASAALDLDSRTDARIVARYSASTYQYPTGSGGGIEDRNAERTEHRLLVGLDAGRRWTDRFVTRIQLAASELHPRTSDGADSPGDTLGFYGYFATGTVTRRLADLRATLRLGAAQHITVGGEFTRDAERSNSLSQSEYGDFPDSFRAARETRALYAQALGSAQRLSYSLGARMDDNSAFGTFRTVRAGLGWQLAPAVRLRASAGTAFKAPSFFENFASGFTIGNEALRPERTRSAELGIDAALRRGGSVRVTGFSQRFRDLIQYTGVPSAPGDPNYYNVAAANAGGVEVEGSLPEIAGVRLTAGYTFTDTRVVDAGFDTGASANFVAGGRLIRRPRHVASLQLTRTVARLGTLSANAIRTGEREDRDFSSFPAAVTFLAPFTTIDLGAELFVPPGLLRSARLQLRAENVANVRYTQIAGFTAPGRTLYAGLKLQR